jgi:hypothetical protein
MNAIARYILGLSHGVGHLGQLAAAIEQSRAAKGA